MLLRLVIIGLLLLWGGVTSNKYNFYVNVLSSKSNPPNVSLCGGALIGSSWVLSCAKCVRRLYKKSDTLMVTAGHSENKPPEQTRDVDRTLIPIGSSDIVLLQMKKPFNVSVNVNFARLPEPGKFPNCSNPVSLEFMQPSEKAVETPTSRLFGMIFGLIVSNKNKPKYPPTPPPFDIIPEDSKSDQFNLYYKSGPRFITTSTTKKKNCLYASGWPLLCDITVIGIETKCKKKGSDEVKTKYASIYRHMRFISNALNNGTLVVTSDDSATTPGPIVIAEASVLGGRNHGVQMLSALIALFFASVIQ